MSLDKNKDIFQIHLNMANQGDMQKQYYVACCYENGIGVQQNFQQAIYWYIKSAKQGYANSQSYLGWCYCTGRYVSIDYKQAIY